MADAERLKQKFDYERKANEKYGQGFLFDPETMEFVIFARDTTYTIPHFAVSDISDLSLLSRKTGINTDINAGIILRSFDVVVQPGIRQYIEDMSMREFTELRELVLGVVRNVFKARSPQMRPWNLVGGPLGFDMIRMDNGNVFIKTLGNAAGIGPAPDLNDWDLKDSNVPYIYGYANTDSAEQSLSSLAGLGTIAWYVQNKINGSQKADESRPEAIIQDKMDL